MSNTIRDEFKVHLLNNTGRDKAIEIAGVFTSALVDLERICGGASREFSIVETKLEEACFFAKRAMAQRTENQQGAETS